MCGIAGFTHKGRPAPEGRIQSAIKCITHRGPDQQGVFESPDVSLGSVRLKIIDLSPLGNQPMRTEDGGTTIVFNGEIYNHPEVRAELEALGHKFNSHCDTEVVLRAFAQWDTKAFERLRGMFGLAIWTESQKRLVIARDRMGIKPLYFHRAPAQNGQDIYFGSELKSIFAHPEVPRDIDLDGLNCYLRLNWVPAPYTLARGIEKLLPGHILEWRSGHVTVAPYWELKPQLNPSLSLEDATAELDSRLQRSVREHLVSDVPLGVWASGGLDSSTILHYASAASDKPLNTFSVTFRGRSFDESEYIQQAAEHYGTHHTEFDLSTDIDIQTAIAAFAYYSDEPSADAGALPVWFLAKMSREHVTVALSGEGADELFGGYLTYLADDYAATARKYPTALRRAALAAMRFWPVSDDKISFEYKVKRFLRGSLMRPEEAHIYWNGTFTEEEKRAIFTAADEAPMNGVLANMNLGSGLNRFMFFDQRYYLADDILYKVDRMSMAHSLEVRPPFLDHRIVEFAATLPQDLKIGGPKRNNELKFILRHLMRDKLPKSILTRPKIGFDIPVHDWFRTILRPLLLETLSEEAVRDSKIFRWPAIEKLINDHLERRANSGYQLWGLLTLFLWMKRWNIQTAPAAEAAPSPAEKSRVPILT
jgi:asparagine synthase (glutamine-hydrolysing)